MDYGYDHEINDVHAYLFDIGTLTRRKPRVSRSERLDLETDLSLFPMISSIGRSQLRTLAKAAHTFTFPAHWTVQQQSGIADVCLLLSEGEVRYLHNGAEVGTAGPGEVLGLEDAVAHHLHRNAAVSATKVRGIAVGSDALVAALAARPEFARTGEFSLQRFAAFSAGGLAG